MVHLTDSIVAAHTNVDADADSDNTAKMTSEMYAASLTLLILDFRISTFRYSTF